MRCRSNSRSTAALAIQLLTFTMTGPAALATGATAETSRDDKSTPQLTVRVYGFAKLSPWLLQASEIQAARLLRAVPVGFNWVNCTSRAVSAICMSDLAATDLIVRVLPNALPQTGPDALGIAGARPGDARAYIFYDRVAGLRTQTRLVPSIMGRVLAHEIVHVLLPQARHSDFGWMRGHWTADDLRVDSAACMGLPVASVQLIQKEAVRRVVSAHNLLLK